MSYTYTITFKNGNTTVRSQTIENGTNTYNVYLVYEKKGGKASSTITRGSGVSLNASDIAGVTYDELTGFSWESSNTSIVTVKTDEGTGIPTATGLSVGKTTIIGKRSDGATIIWTVTVENGTSSQIVFAHRAQDNTDFTAKGDSYRPYSEYGYGSTEPTNLVQFVVVLADKNGHLVMNGSKPNVELPTGSVVPDNYVFDLGTDGVFKINENTFGGISVPGYSYAGAYAYFGWYSNSDTEAMAVVDTFKNFGRVSTNYPNYYSVLGFTTSRGTGSDYSASTFGAAGAGYYAYNPTGVLMLVLKPVDDDISYKTNYHNDYNPKGLAKTNVVDTTSARMIKGEWLANEYTYNYHGETIMTSLTENDLTPPSDDYKFDGWYDSVDSEGNGTGNKIIGNSQNENGKTYYFAVTESDNKKIEIVANNDIYVRWIPKISQFTITKTIRGGLSSDEISVLKNTLEFDVVNGSSEVVRTIPASNMTWNENVGIYTLEGISVAESYTIVEKNAEVTGHTLDAKTTYPDNGESVKPSMTENVNVSVENKYTANIVVRKVDHKLSNMKDVEFTLSNGGSNNIVITTNENGLATFSNIKCGETYILAETNTPSDYYALHKAIQISVSDNGEITIDNEAELDGFVSKNKSGEIQVVNIKHVSMPKAGGMGTHWFHACGILIMGFSSLIYIKKNKIKF